MLRLRRQSTSPVTPPKRVANQRSLRNQNNAKKGKKSDETLIESTDFSLAESASPKNGTTMKVRYFMEEQRVEIELENIGGTRV